MAFPDLALVFKKTMPELRGRLLANQSLAELTWFRVGGPAQLLFMPEDEADLAYFLKNLPADIPVCGSLSAKPPRCESRHRPRG